MLWFDSFLHPIMSTGSIKIFGSSSLKAHLLGSQWDVSHLLPLHYTDHINERVHQAYCDSGYISILMLFIMHGDLICGGTSYIYIYSKYIWTLLQLCIDNSWTHCEWKANLGDRVVVKWLRGRVGIRYCEAEGTWQMSSCSGKVSEWGSYMDVADIVELMSGDEMSSSTSQVTDWQSITWEQADLILRRSIREEGN